VDVFVANEQAIPLDEDRLSSLARHTLMEEKIGDGAELSVLLVDEGHIKQLNARFAGNDYATDVLAFPMMEDGEDDTLLLGDVVICPQVAERNAGEMGHGLVDELDALVVHGTLHLLGYDHQDQDEKAKMDERLGEVLASFKQVQA
jgi:probable rRNA maturation factor